MHRHAFEALDCTLRDILGQIDPQNRNIPFGNKIIVFGGDFRQILHVVNKGKQIDIVNASFNRSYRMSFNRSYLTSVKILKVFSRLIQAEISFGNLNSILIKKCQNYLPPKN